MLIDFDQLVSRFKVQAKGVLHLGASEGQEAPAYAKHGYKMAFVEALPHVHAKLVQNVAQYNAVTYNECVGDVEGKEVEFNIANNGGQSSSMLEFGTHTREHPSVRFIGKTRMKMRRVDNLVKDIHEYDLLVMDLQGAELMALKGIGDKLDGFNYVYTEVNKRHLYKGCPLVGELDEYLKGFGFERVETKFTQWHWGDALYIKKGGRTNKPDEFSFRFKQETPYPGHSQNDFENWFSENFTPGENERTYLPITWTSFQLKYEKDKPARNRLQDYLNSLDRTKKYFTIVQHDDGIKFNLPFDCKVFGMGKESGYPLPLICEPHKFKFTKERDLIANFIGNRTHPLRNQILRIKADGFLLSANNYEESKFCEVLARSVFTLCPRGYGITSFRIMEAIQQGSIPIYVSDRFIIPHNHLFDDYGVLINSKDVARIPEILAAIPKVEIERKQARLKHVFDEYYTYEANLKLVKEAIKLG